jgi:O-antigen chain-terminating methyltransferase
MNVRSVMDEIHARIENRNRRSLATGAETHSFPAELASLRSAYDRMYKTRHLVGEMPPSPDTLRARTGRHLVRLVQRCLFWYTPQIRLFQDETTQAMASLCKLVEYQLAAIGTLQREVKALRESAISERSVELPAQVPVTAGSLPPGFEFALQDHFRGSEADTGRKLTHWLQKIRSASAPIGRDEARWLDIGCGRGEWLSILQAAGYRGIGIDMSALAVQQCLAAGLEAEQSEALDYLKRQPDASLSVITAFHVVEHLPMDCLLALLPLARKKLCVGGVLVVETPNPANLLMGAHHFWNDPTHVRPIPADFLEFSLRYFGFEIAVRADLNPAPAADHLPYTEVDLVRRVDDLLYGPQDYGLIGRRAS